jgi:hypothetical protein
MEDANYWFLIMNNQLNGATNGQLQPGSGVRAEGRPALMPIFGRHHGPFNFNATSSLDFDSPCSIE